jgi:MFS family permease
VAAQAETPGRYPWYALGVLTLVYVFNFVDRQIPAILAEPIQADLGLGDAELGFLYGTAFAVFYAVFGIPLGRLADVWVRRSLIATGLFAWSAMTALSATARSFAALGAFRIGVGIGEASATPAAFSMLVDWFPERRRATALSLYSGGLYLGGGLGIFLGGWIVDGWAAAFPESPPLGLRGWQAAFLAVGLPGLVMALWVRTLREPPRGGAGGERARGEPSPAPLVVLLREVAAVLPPFTVWSLARAGAGPRGLAANLAASVALAALVLALVRRVGGAAQWCALGVGVYAALSWVQGLALRDPPTFASLFRSRALLWACVGFPCLAFVGYGFGFWMPPFFLRVHGASAAEVGTWIGLTGSAGGWLGVTAGGLLSDRLRQRWAQGRLAVGVLGGVATAPLALALLAAEGRWNAYALHFALAIAAALWVGSAAATVNELVLPRMRAAASAFYLLMVTFIGLALGPWTIGRLSDALTAAGADRGEALAAGMRLGLLALGVGVACLLVAARHIERDERKLRESAARSEAKPSERQSY